MLKKSISIILAVMILLTAAAVNISAAGVEITGSGAEPDTAPTGSDCIIKFDAASAGWDNASYIQFYIYEIGGSELRAWGSKKNRGTKGDDGIWSYDAAEAGVTDGVQYAIIFYNEDTTAETYQLILDISCDGCTAYCTGNQIENPVDSNKVSLEVRWDNSTLGPMLAITSIGNVVGETCPANTTRYDMFMHFLTSDGKDSLQNAINYSGKTQDEIINSVGSCLGLSDSDIEKAVEEAGLGGDPGPSDRFRFEISVTSYLSDSDTVSISIIHGNTGFMALEEGNNVSFVYPDGITAGKYTVTISKENHVTREYEIEITGDTYLDAKICPIGDVTMDGQVTTMDVTRANSYVKGKAALENYALQCADVLPSTEGVTTMDVTRINSHVQKVKPLW